jgi:hypothetical protein
MTEKKPLWQKRMTRVRGKQQRFLGSFIQKKTKKKKKGRIFFVNKIPYGILISRQDYKTAKGYL